MNKYIIDTNTGEKNTAGSKARMDITNILENDGYEKILYRVPSNKIRKLLFSKFQWMKALNEVENGEIVFQYPLYSRSISTQFFNALKNIKIKKIAIIHDLEFLRSFKERKGYLEKEISLLNSFDLIVSHNKKMSALLIRYGIPKEKIRNLELFDYLNPHENVQVDRKTPIVFAGNLGKSDFLKNVDIDSKLNLFGINPESSYHKNVTYKGLYTPEELPQYLAGSFGLIWDGTSLETCDGIMGEYMQYNNPHKTSLYLSCGLPVLIWEKAAMADFIVENNLGRTISSIYEIDDIVSQLTDDEYETIVKNVQQLSNKVKNGYYIKKALSSEEN